MRNLLIYTLFVFLLFGCTDEVLEDLNVDTKKPTVLAPEPLIVNAIIHLGYYINNINPNDGILKLINQQWTQVTYIKETNYDFLDRNIPEQNWIRLYRDVLLSLKKADEFLKVDATKTDDEKKNIANVIEILNVYAFVLLVETFGDIPYSEALDTKNLSPKYDDAKTVYDDLLKRINDARSALKATSSGVALPANSDPIYRGSKEKWIAFAASLELKMAITISDDDPTKAQTIAESLVSDVFQNESQSARLAYQNAAPNTNPLYEDLTLSGRNDYIPAASLVDQMNETNDPRRKLYFTVFDGGYKGGLSGKFNLYSNYSHIHPNIAADPDRLGEILSYVAVKFYLAEGAARGWNVGGTAENLFNEAVTASIIEWGGTQQDVLDYLNQPALNYDETNWKTMIGTQKWIAMVGLPHEGWVSLRLLDEPRLSPPENPISKFPVRYHYPISEQTLNPSGYSNVKDKDSVEDKIFWDKNDYINKVN